MNTGVPPASRQALPPGIILLMFRRALRIFLVVFSALFLAVILISQFYAILIKVPPNAIQIEQQGVTFMHSRFFEGWEVRLTSEINTWAAKYLLLPPHLGSKGGSGFVSAFLPWWLLLIAWTATFILAWRLTREKKSHAFPVQPPSLAP